MGLWLPIDKHILTLLPSCGFFFRLLRELICTVLLSRDLSACVLSSADCQNFHISAIAFIYVSRSDLVEGGDINWLDEVLEGLNLLLKVISWNLFVFDDTTNDELLNTVGNGSLLVLSLPEETILLDGNDLLGEVIKVGLSLVGLDLEEDEWLGNWLFLLFLLVGLLCLLKLLLGFLLIIN